MRERGHDLTLRKPKAVQKKGGASNKKRKRGDGEAAEVSKANARIGTRSEHFLQFISVMLWIHLMSIKCLVAILS
jgi:hypothetical protein